MVKVDPKRDYYGDLDLPYGASVDDVKKQFRKLAKLYHPDRNPGREVECIPKFQAIQAANEILTDPTQKNKYDQDRRKAGYVPTVSQKSTGSHKPTSAFPPPPRPRPATAQAKSAHPTPGTKPPPSAGAQIYAGWARSSAQKWQSAKDEAQARQDAFRGFSDMKTGSNRAFPPPPPGPPPQHGRYAPTAKRPTSSHAPPPPPTDPPKPTESWDRFPAGFPGMSRTQTRRHGFDPTTPGEDEHMAGTSAYAGVHRSAPKNSYFDTGTTPSSDNDVPRADRASPLRHTKSHEGPSARPELQRQSTRYATSGGEKTNLNINGLGRSASVRNSPIDPRYEDRAYRSHSHHGTARFRSASPGFRGHRTEATYSPDSTSSESSSEEEIEIKARPGATARGHTRNNTVPNNWTRETFDKNFHSPQQENTATYQYPPPPPQNAPYFPESSARADPSHGSGSRRPAAGTSEDEDPNLASAMKDLPKAFSASEWDGKIGSNHFTPVVEEVRRSPSKTTRKAAAQSRGRTNSPDKYYDTSTSAEPDQPNSNTTNAFQPPKFDADKWQQQLNERNWAAPTPEVGSSKTPKRSGRSTSTLKKPQSYPAPPQVVIDDGSVPGSAPSKLGASGSAMVDEMDIDTPGQQTPRTEHLPNGHPSAGVRQPDPSPGAVNLEDLQHVHPFKSSSTGLGDLEDLNTMLPFESRASGAVDLGIPPSTSKVIATVKNLKLPKPPIRPPAPMEDPLPPAMWISYANLMSAYMKEWSMFNKAILQHFETRQVRVDHSMAKNWIEAVGDGPTEIDIAGAKDNRLGIGAQAGYKTYSTWIDQDAAIREWWGVACEKHAEAIRELGVVRAKMKKANRLH